MTAKESLALIAEIHQKMKDSYDFAEEERLERQINDVIKRIVPEVGLKCTIVYWSDYRAATIVEVNEKKDRVGVAFNKVKCKDYYGGAYEISDELETEEAVRYFTKRRNFQWVQEDHPTKDGVVLVMHYHRHYIDPSY